MPDVSIFVPVLNRPHNAARQVHDIMEATTTDFEIMFISTVNDVDQIDVCKALARSYSFVRHFSITPQKTGDYAKKINRAFLESDAPWIFTGADDLHFHPGWYEAAITAYAATGKSVVGTNDLGNKRVINGEHSTHSLVRRWYVDTYGTIDEDGKVLHEGYPHEFVDDEFIETARARDEFVHAHRSVVEHMHPLWGKAPTDHLYDAQSRRMAQGRRIYHQRRRKWTSR
jgi:glycosyltransferase involved in cell wall biosynthesis